VCPASSTRVGPLVAAPARPVRGKMVFEASLREAPDYNEPLTRISHQDRKKKGRNKK
jgi:hypothetical protein